MSKDIDTYNKLKDDLIKKIIEKNELLNKLSELENSIYEKEYNYFNDSYYGNIIKGFDNFSKTSNSSNNKKKLPFYDQDHIFSLSSYNFIKTLKKNSSLTDFDDYEDSVEPVNLNLNLNNLNLDLAQKSVDLVSNTSTPSRKRKIRSLDD